MFAYLMQFTHFASVMNKLKNTSKWVVENEDKIKKVLLAIIGIYVAFCVCYTTYTLYSLYFVGKSDERASDKLGTITSQQQQIITNIQATTERLDNTKETIGQSINTANSISQGLGNLIDGTSTVEAILRDNQQRISDSQAILNQARKGS